MDRAPRNIGHLDAMEREQELRDRLAASQERERALREALEAAHTILRDADLDEYVGPQIRAALAETPGPRIAPRP